jgi:hypothetical protein
LSGLSLVRFTKTNNAHAALRFRKAEYVQAILQISGGHKSALRVVVADVLNEIRLIPPKISSPLETQAAQYNIPFTLGWIEGNFHRPDCMHNKIKFQAFCTYNPIVQTCISMHESASPQAYRNKFLKPEPFPIIDH